MQNPPSRVRSPCDLGRLERWKSRAALGQSAGSRGETCPIGPAMAQPAQAGFVRTEPHLWKPRKESGIRWLGRSPAPTPWPPPPILGEGERTIQAATAS